MSSSFKNTSIRDTGFLKLPKGTTAERPSAANGQLRYNTTLGYSEYYDGSNWVPVIGNKTFMNDGSGGKISFDGPHKKHTFNYDLIYCDNTTGSNTHTSSAAAWTNSDVGKKFKVAEDGKIAIVFEGYIQSGPQYWCWRIKRTRPSGFIDYFPSSSGVSWNSQSRSIGAAGTDYGYLTRNDYTELAEDGASGYSGTGVYVHVYVPYIYENIDVRAGDVIMLELTSASGGGTPTTGSGQILYAKNFKAYQTEYVFKPSESGYVEVLTVGGGGGGGAYAAGGGGGAGGLVYKPYYWVTAGTEYTVKVGRGGFGGWGQSINAQNGANSSFGTDIVSIGGGRGGLGWNPGTFNGGDGGSGGGGQGYDGSAGTAYTSGGGGSVSGAGASLVNGQGSRGGRGKGVSGNSGSAGGGGGAGRFGLDATDSTGGSGGGGMGFAIHKLIGGTVQSMAGGGGGAAYNGPSQGSGGSSVGGFAGAPTYLGQNWAAPNTGSGGGGNSSAGGSANPMSEWGGNGASGLVVVRYVARRPKVTMMFVTGSRWEVPAGVTSVEVLAVGGGGGGGYDQGGGGGAGGVVYTNMPVTGGQVYNITIGQAGSGSSSASSTGSAGTTTSIVLNGGGGFNGGIYAYGGGGGGSMSSKTGGNGASGGGGAGYDSTYSKSTPGENTGVGQGFDGGKGGRYAGGGGGGAGGAGENSKIIGSGSSGFGGNGGPGLPFAITGSMYIYSEGGAGGSGGSNSRGGRGGDMFQGGFGGRGAADGEAGGNGQNYGCGGGGAHTAGAGGSGVQGVLILRFSI